MANPSYDGSVNPALNGTTIKVPAGLYNGGSFGKLKNCTIDLSACSFTAPITFNNLDTINVIGGIHFGVKGNARNLQGKHKNVNFKGAKFTACDQIYSIVDLNTPYNGSDDDLVLNNVTFDSETIDDCGLFLTGNPYASGSNPICYSDLVTQKDSNINNTRTNGTQIRATIFRLSLIRIKVTYTIGKTNPVSGDVGYAYISGSAYEEDCVMLGDAGYWFRVWHTQRKRKNAAGAIEVIAADTTIKNSVRGNTTRYGMVDLRPDESDGLWSQRGGNFYVLNNTEFNAADDIQYWSSIAVIGDLAYSNTNAALPANSGVMRCHVENNLGANISTLGQGGGNAPKDPISFQQGGTNLIASDVKNNKYLASANGVIDPATGYKLMPDQYPGIGAVPTGTVVTPPVVVPPVVTPPVVVAKTIVKQEVVVSTSYTVKTTFSDGSSESHVAG